MSNAVLVHRATDIQRVELAFAQKCKAEDVVEVIEMQTRPTTRTSHNSPRKGERAAFHAHLTVRLLSAGTRTVTTELLGLRATGVGDQKGAVVGDEQLAELEGGGSVVVLGVVGNQGLGDGLADGVDLRGLTTTGHTQTDVDGPVQMWKRGQIEVQKVSDWSSMACARARQQEHGNVNGSSSESPTKAAEIVHRRFVRLAVLDIFLVQVGDACSSSRLAFLCRVRKGCFEPGRVD